MKKVAFIAGGTGYIGSSIKDKLQTIGWKVIIGSRNEGEDILRCDLTNLDSVETCLRKIIEKHGRLDVSIHCASPAIERTGLLATSPESFREHMTVALDGTLNLARASLPLIPADGAFIAITSAIVFEDISRSKSGAYALAKRAHQELVEFIAKEAPEKRIFAVAPDFLPNGLNRDLPEAIRKKYSKRDNGTIASADDVVLIVQKIAEGVPGFIESSSVDIYDGSASRFQ